MIFKMDYMVSVSFISIFLLIVEIKISTCAHAQWVEFKIENQLKESIFIRNAHIEWGKWIPNINKKHLEIDNKHINRLTADPDEIVSIASCGREHSASGTEGHFDILNGTGSLIRRVYFDCPWGSKKNKLAIVGNNPDYIVNEENANLQDGALGTISLKVQMNGQIGPLKTKAKTQLEIENEEF